MANDSLGDAQQAKNDEFYTQYGDIEKEMNAYLDFNEDVFRDKTVLLPCDDPEWSNFTKYFAQNFERLGLKKLISTSYAPNSKPKEIPYYPPLFELESDDYDPEKSHANGKIFVVVRDVNLDNQINVQDIEWSYLEGDGDFRSDEVTALRDEADIIITNPPFSLFREFLAWLVEVEKDFVILGNVNSVTYKEVFPFIMKNKLWLGATRTGVGQMWFIVPDNAPIKTGQKEEGGHRYQTVGSTAWFTTLDHGRRHEPLVLMTGADNIKFSKHKEVKGVGYAPYDNYEAIEVPRTDSIPSDFAGVMGVPISFLSKYNPDQFELLGMSANGGMPSSFLIPGRKKYDRPYLDGKRMYVRLFIRHRKAAQ